jgi:hypothetical protein
MPKTDFDAGREVGIHEGRRLASAARRWTDLIILAAMVGCTIVVLQFQARAQQRDLDKTNRNLYEGCMTRNAIVERQIRFYEQSAGIERGNRFIDELVRKQRVEAYEGTAKDIKALGMRDCTVYQR